MSNLTPMMAAAMAVALQPRRTMTRRPMPEIRELPEDAMPNPPVDPEEDARRHAEGIRQVEERQRRIEVRAAANFAMQRNPYPNNRQGRRRWARELAKLATSPSTR